MTFTVDWALKAKPIVYLLWSEVPIKGLPMFTYTGKLALSQSVSQSVSQLKSSANQSVNQHAM